MRRREVPGRAIDSAVRAKRSAGGGPKSPARASSRRIGGAQCIGGAQYSVLMVLMSVLFIPERWPIWLVSPRLDTMVGSPLLLNAVEP